MAKSQETFNKKEKEKLKKKKREEKEQRKQERKANAKDKDSSFEIAYVDEFGNFSSTPPDPNKKKKVIAEQIEIGVQRRKEDDTPDVGRTGVVTFFNNSKGFGFIKDAKTQESIFTHINGHLDSIKENDRVSFQVEQGPKGLNAVNVKLVV